MARVRGELPDWLLAIRSNDPDLYYKCVQKETLREFFKDIFGKSRSPVAIALEADNTRPIRFLLKLGADPTACCWTTAHGESENAFEYLRDLIYMTRIQQNEPNPILETRKSMLAILQHHVEHPPRLCATAWVIAQLPGAWPEMIEPILKRLAKIKPGK